MHGKPNKCEQCGKEFENRWPRSDKKFCSTRCRQAAYRERKWAAKALAQDLARSEAASHRNKLMKKAAQARARRKRKRVT